MSSPKAVRIRAVTVAASSPRLARSQSVIVSSPRPQPQSRIVHVRELSA